MYILIKYDNIRAYTIKKITNMIIINAVIILSCIVEAFIYKYMRFVKLANREIERASEIYGERGRERLKFAYGSNIADSCVAIVVNSCREFSIVDSLPYCYNDNFRPRV